MSLESGRRLPPSTQLNRLSVSPPQAGEPALGPSWAEGAAGPLAHPHACSAHEVAAALGVAPAAGLTRAEAAHRLERHGPNELKTTPRPRFAALLLRQFRSLLVAVLLVASALSLLVGDPSDTLVILVVVVINALIGATQESRADQALASLRALSSPTARVLRDADLQEVPARDVVPGDVALVRAGDLVPADGRLLEAASMRVDESPLTGESAPVDKDARPRLMVETPLADRTTMLYAGTAVTYGHGRLVVTATGATTEVGGLARAVAETRPQPTPLERQVVWLGKVLSLLALAASGIVFFLGLLRGLPLAEMFLVGVSLAVAAVPEGLPAVVTIVLALGVQRMARRNAVVRRLASVEALGAATVICTDKTGTLTLNDMRVAVVLIGSRRLELRDGVLFEGGQPVLPDMVPGLSELLCAAALSNNAHLGPMPAGDPTERALLRLAADLRVDRAIEEQNQPRIGEIPFSSDRKRMTTLHSTARGLKAYVKGAPDGILEACTAIIDAAGPRPLTATDRAAIDDVIQEQAGQGLRLLALASRSLDQPIDGHQLLRHAAHLERDLTLLGIVGLIDPPRPEVPPALEACRAARIRVVMVTGDHPATAVAIARRLGIDAEAPLTGAQLERLPDGGLARAAVISSVYARVTPHQKVEIVRALQAGGDVVAMTGDGANDAPALRLADIGVAMGIRGTAVAREAAAMVLTDDNFASIVAAIEEGRTIYANLRKTMLYLLSGNLGEILVLVVAMLVGLPLPLLPVQILWVNLLTDALPAIGLGMEPPEPDLMRHPPRRPGEHFLPRWSVPLIVVTSTLLALSALVPFVLTLGRDPTDLVTARSAAFVSLVLAHLGIGWAMRSTHAPSLTLPLRSNPTLLFGLLAGCGVVLLASTELGRLLFHTRPLDPMTWLLAVALMPLPFAAAEGVKWVLRAVPSATVPAQPTSGRMRPPPGPKGTLP